VVLQYLVAAGATGSHLNRYNFSLPGTLEGYPREYQERISYALMEAWVWLEREGLLAPRPGTQGEWVFVTRRGRQLATREDLDRYRHGELLPRQLLHPRIAQKVWATFLRGDYDTAVFQAFKEVEVRTREAGGFADADIGTDLVRAAFNPRGGPLTNMTTPSAEREALAHLFAGAIGSYKNPQSHRNVTVERLEAVEMIIIASHLLGILDHRAPQARAASSRESPRSET
jgi:uncharacterized protein (TIGR02391 family)